MNAQSSTIAALLTPLTPGAIAVVGLTGPNADAILGRILSAPDKTRGSDVNKRVSVAPVSNRCKRAGAPSRPLPAFGTISRKHLTNANTDHLLLLPDRRPTFCQIAEDDRIIDDVVVVRIERNHGTAAEICTHGGIRIAQRTLLLLERNGAKIVDGWLYHEIVSGSNPIERDVDRALATSASRRLTHWLLKQRAILPGYVQNSTAAVDSDRSAFLARSRVAVGLIAGMHIAVTGPPNAGKSTLANRLIGKDRVITSDRPGTTRDWIAETVLIDGWPVILTDTAGLRRTECRIEADAIRRGREQTHQADAILVVIDAATPPAEQRREWDEILPTLPDNRPRLLVHNKMDHPDAAEMTFPDVNTYAVSALTGDGIESLEKGLSAALGLDLLDDDLPAAFLPDQFPDGVD